MDPRLKNRANGIDYRKVDPDAIYDTKSVGNSTTLPVDETDPHQIESTFKKLSQRVAERLEAKNLCGTTISIQIRDCHWNNYTRSKTLQNPISWKKIFLGNH